VVPAISFSVGENTTFPREETRRPSGRWNWSNRALAPSRLVAKTSRSCVSPSSVQPRVKTKPPAKARRITSSEGDLHFIRRLTARGTSFSVNVSASFAGCALETAVDTNSVASVATRVVMRAMKPLRNCVWNVPCNEHSPRAKRLFINVNYA
jgi:hypothetical protein